MIGPDDLMGRWTLTRQITDHAGGPSGQLEGQARFTEAPDGLDYHEEGLLRLGTAPPIRATRRYLWRWETAQVAVFFADGTDFHRFDAHDPNPKAKHHCAPDHYRVAYDFSLFPVWTSTWRVTGPRKDYLMQSRFNRT